MDKFVRLHFIDLLRGISILMVVIYHFFGTSIFKFGNYGVGLFFIISGYCISQSTESSINAIDFYSKRLGRLLPALFVCGFLTMFIKNQFPYLIIERPVNFFDPLLTVISLPTLNLLHIKYHFPDGSYWSLLIEFQFYALISFLILTTKKSELLVRLIFIMITFPLLPYLGLWKHPPHLVYFLPFFVLGFSLRELRVQSSKMVSYLGIFFSILVYLTYIFYKFESNSLSSSFAGLLFLILSIPIFNYGIKLETLDFFNPNRNSIVKFLTFLGIVSYPLYLLHQDIGNTLLYILDAHCETLECAYNTIGYRLLLIPILMTGLASVVYFGVEKPFIKILSEFFKSLFTCIRQFFANLATLFIWQNKR